MVFGWYSFHLICTLLSSWAAVINASEETTSKVKAKYRSLAHRAFEHNLVWLIVLIQLILWWSCWLVLLFFMSITCTWIISGISLPGLRVSVPVYFASFKRGNATQNLNPKKVRSKGWELARGWSMYSGTNNPQVRGVNTIPWSNIQPCNMKSGVRLTQKIHWDIRPFPASLTAAKSTLILSVR